MKVILGFCLILGILVCVTNAYQLPEPPAQPIYIPTVNGGIITTRVGNFYGISTDSSTIYHKVQAPFSTTDCQKLGSAAMGINDSGVLYLCAITNGSLKAWKIQMEEVLP